MNQINLLKTFDGIVGRHLVSVLHRWKYHRNGLGTFGRLLIIRPGGIGDAVLLLPAIRFLREKFPDSVIDILCEKRNAEIFRLSSDINKIYLYDKGLDLFRTVRNKYDVVIDTEQWHRLSAVISRLAGAPIRIGFDTNERKKMFTHQIPYSHDDYEVYSFLHLIEPLTGENPPFDVDKPFIDISNDAASLPQSDLRAQDNLIAIFPGASVPERRWGGDNFGRVAHALSNKGHKIVILGSGSEKKDAEKIRELATSAMDLTGKTNLRDVATLLRVCKLLITADSGLLHIAYAVGTPTVSLFGSGLEKKWAPLGKKHRVLNQHIACSPCTRFGYTPRCRRNVECLLSVSPDEVVRTAETLLDDNARPEN